MNIYLFWFIIGLMGLAYLWIGKTASESLEDNEDYYLMHRRLTFFPLCLTLLATQLGGGTLVGAAQEAYLKGWLVLFYPAGVCLGLFTLSMGFGAKLRSLNISTMAEIFEKIYKSRTQRYLASALSIISLFFILVGQAIAARKFFVALGVIDSWAFFLFWTVLVTYTVMGGFKAVVNTDVLQISFVLIVLMLTYFSIDTPSIPSPSSEPLPLDNAVPWTTWLFMPFLFMLIEQDMGQRCFAAKSPRTVSFAAFAAGVLLILASVVAVYLGVEARRLGIEVSASSSILIEAVKVLTNPTVATFFMAAVLMTVISTADSLLCSISSNLSCDFLPSTGMQQARWITLITGLSALGIAIFFDNVVSMLMLSYELSVCVLFVPIAAAILSKTPSRLGAYSALFIGSLGFVAFRIVEPPLPREILTIGLATVGYFLGKALSATSEAETLLP